MFVRKKFWFYFYYSCGVKHRFVSIIIDVTFVREKVILFSTQWTLVQLTYAAPLINTDLRVG